MYKAIGNNYQRMTEAYIFRGDRGIDNQARSKDFFLDEKNGLGIQNRVQPWKRNKADGLITCWDRLPFPLLMGLLIEGRIIKKL